MTKDDLPNDAEAACKQYSHFSNSFMANVINMKLEGGPVVIALLTAGEVLDSLL